MDRNFRKIALWKMAVKGNISALVEDALGLKKGPPKDKFIPLGSAGPGTSIMMSSNAVQPDGAVDIVINYRGLPGDPRTVANTGLRNAVIVTAEAIGPQSKNMGSTLLEQQFGNAASVNSIVSTVLSHLKKQFPDKPIHRGKLILSGFSGGGGAITDIVAQRNQVNGDIDGIILNDALHAKPGGAGMNAILEFAKEAAKNPNKKLRMLHTAVIPSRKNPETGKYETYTSTTETADYILAQLGLKRQSPGDEMEFEDVGFVPTSEARLGGLEIYAMYDKVAPYFVDNRPGSMGDQHVQAAKQGYKLLFRDL